MRNITKDEYKAQFDGDLTEACELFLRHASIYVETTAVSTEEKTAIVTRVCKIDHKIDLLLEHDGINADTLEEIEYFECDSMTDVTLLYANLIFRYQNEVSI